MAYKENRMVDRYMRTDSTGCDSCHITLDLWLVTTHTQDDIVFS